jgi:hypothetical protein
MADLYVSANNTSALFVPAKAATVYAAHEQSLFLGGEMIPVVNAPNGVLQVPFLAGVSASSLAGNFGGSDAGDVGVTNPADTKNTISADLIAARSVVRDLGNIDPSEIGRSLGNAVADKFDAAVMDALGNLTAQEAADAAGKGVMDISDIATAVQTIRGAGETGQLYGVIAHTEYAALMADIGSTAFAGGDLFQGQALRSGFFGNIFGVQLFVTSKMTDANTGVTNPMAAIFGADAMRIAMQKNVDLEIARRAEAVGNDVVASLHAGVGVVDANRGVMILNAAT